jgi:hypothetical protein
MDIGASDGEALSNTITLDMLGWPGVCVDPFPLNMHLRTCQVVRTAVSGDGLGREFATSDGEEVLAGFVDSLGLHKNLVLGRSNRTIMLETMTPGTVLAATRLPATIGYVNLDIEGAELEVIQAWPWDQYQIGVLTVEHNFEEPKRTMIRDLLLANGMILVEQRFVDDWYVRASLVDSVRALQKHGQMWSHPLTPVKNWLHF